MVTHRGKPSLARHRAAPGPRWTEDARRCRHGRDHSELRPANLSAGPGWRHRAGGEPDWWRAARLNRADHAERWAVRSVDARARAQPVELRRPLGEPDGCYFVAGGAPPDPEPSESTPRALSRPTPATSPMAATSPLRLV